MDAFWIILTGSLVAVSCAILGSFLILRKMSMVGDAISHSVLPGIVIAFFIAGSMQSVWMLVGAILFILSDCVLALNIFDIQPEKHSATAKALAIANMILYLGGQFMIAVGAVYHQEDISSEQVDSALSA